MIEYIKADLVKMQLNDYEYKLHGCNALGKWGRGIALIFKNEFPQDYMVYQNWCAILNSQGTALITPSKIVCLVTSVGYSPPDTINEIMRYTSRALSDLAIQLPKDAHVYSNRFNSGIFRVPWEMTEPLIEEFLKTRPDITWTVCDL